MHSFAAIELETAMSERARELAMGFDRVAEEFAGEIEGISDDQWRLDCVEEGRTVAALAHHVAWAYEVEIDAFAAIAEGRAPRTMTREALNEANAEHGQRFVDCDKVETVELLRRNAAKASAIVRGLTDEQLERRGAYVGEHIASVDWWIERILIGHPGMHLPAIRATVGMTEPDADRTDR
jgi:hypothetical protein